MKFCIEQRERAGDDCQLQLKLMGFNWHHRVVSYDNKNPKENDSWIEGFRTNNVTRPLLTGRFVDAINNGWYKPNSKWMIEEMKTWERKTLATGKTRMDHPSGKKDDRVISGAMSYFSRHAFDIMAERATKRYALPIGKMAPINRDPVNSCMVSVGE